MNFEIILLRVDTSFAVLIHLLLLLSIDLTNKMYWENTVITPFRFTRGGPFDMLWEFLALLEYWGVIHFLSILIQTLRDSAQSQVRVQTARIRFSLNIFFVCLSKNVGYHIERLAVLSSAIINFTHWLVSIIGRMILQNHSFFILICLRFLN